MPARPQPFTTAFRSSLSNTHVFPNNLPYRPSFPARNIPSKCPSRLNAQVRERLLSLPYRALLQAVLHLMSAWGYDQAAPAGRSGFKGRNTAGGWDLEARSRTDGGETARAIAQVKQFGHASVPQRMVDELRGCLLRAGADEAWLITLSTFSGPARTAALSGGGAAPVRLLDGEGLAEQMIQNQVGICRSGPEWAVDERYFRMLERRFTLGMAEARSDQEQPGKLRKKPEPAQGGAVPPAPASIASVPRGQGGPAAVVRVTIICGLVPKDDPNGRQFFRD